MKADQLFSFKVWLKGNEEHGSIYNHRSAAKARYQYLLDNGDCFPDKLPFALVRSRKIGAPLSDPSVERVAHMRGRPELIVGARVQVGSSLGRIVGSNSSANFDVLFDDDDPEYRGGLFNVHPGDIVRIGTDFQ